MRKQTKELLKGLNLKQKEILLFEIIEWYGLFEEPHIWEKITKIKKSVPTKKLKRKYINK